METYMPPPALREIAERHREIEWLCYLTPRERRFHARQANLRRLLALYPTVTDEEWLLILKHS
jgi:hypothetical protein